MILPPGFTTRKTSWPQNGRTILARKLPDRLRCRGRRRECRRHVEHEDGVVLGIREQHLKRCRIAGGVGIADDVDGV